MYGNSLAGWMWGWGYVREDESIIRWMDGWMVFRWMREGVQGKTKWNAGKGAYTSASLNFMLNLRLTKVMELLDGKLFLSSASWMRTKRRGHWIDTSTTWRDTTRYGCDEKCFQRRIGKRKGKEQLLQEQSIPVFWIASLCTMACSYFPTPATQWTGNMDSCLNRFPHSFDVLQLHLYERESEREIITTIHFTEYFKLELTFS